MLYRIFFREKTVDVHAFLLARQRWRHPTLQRPKLEEGRCREYCFGTQDSQIGKLPLNMAFEIPEEVM